MTERFIAFAISSVSIVPEAPTSMPATIRTVFESTKPVADAARPVNALSSEITTGMSAPPIGSTNRMPKSSASPTRSHSTHWSCTPATSATPRATVASRTAMLKMFWPGNVIGRPLSSSCSFANAIIEPANEIEPISAERTVETEAVVARPRGRDVELGQRDERRRAAADPVEQGHHLRHRGHLHRARADEADRGADQRRR